MCIFADIIEANSEVVTTLQNSALQQADAANHTIHLQNSLAEMIAMRNMQMLEMQRQLAVLGAQQELLYLGWPAANVQNSNSFLGNIQLLLDLQQAQNALIIEETCWRLAVAQGNSTMLFLFSMDYLFRSPHICGLKAARLGLVYDVTVHQLH